MAYNYIARLYYTHLTKR